MKLKIIFFILVWFLSFSSSANEPLFKNITIQQSCEPNSFYNSYIRFASNGENHIAIQSSQIIINTSIKRKSNIIKFYFESTKDLGRGGINIPWGEISKKKEVLTLITLDNAKGIHSIQWHGLYNNVTKKYLLQNLFQIKDDTFRSCVLNESGEWINYISPPKYSKPKRTQCLTKKEKEKVKTALKTMENNYGDVPNYIQCDTKRNKLEKYVCADKSLLLAFDLESKSSVYAYENATKTEVNHLTHNKINGTWNQNYIDGDKELSNLCYDLKAQTSASLGGETPYIEAYSTNITDSFFVQENKHGISLLANNKKIYVGKECDVIDSFGKNGTWYKAKGKYIIIFEGEKLEIDFIEGLNINATQCSQKDKEKPKNYTESARISSTNEKKISKLVVIAKQAPEIIPPQNAKVIKTKKGEPIKSASGSISLVFLASALGLLGWKFKNIM